ncbi:MAG: serine hydrolase [Desulfobacterales bacterium]
MTSIKINRNDLDSYGSGKKYVAEILNKLSGPCEPGIQYIVVDKNSTIYERSVGLCDVAAKKSLTLHNTMAAFSMTKMLTAITVLQLIEQDKVELNDRVDRYIKHPYDSEITVRQLLNHTSGIPNPIPLKWVHLASKHNT